MNEIELDRRSREILETVIISYIESGEPVGSRTVARLNREGLSPASIRNVMADLEEKDLLRQPHASAGRVPTDLAYRVYVDSIGKAPRLSLSEERLIASTLERTPGEISDLFGNVSRVLSSYSRHLGVVVSPHIARVRLRDIEFVRVAPHRVLAVIVAASGLIHNKMIEISDDYDQESLDKFGRYLTDEFRGHTLPEIRDRILELMTQEKAAYDRMLRDALSLGRVSLEVEADEKTGGAVFVDGTANLLSDPEFASVERLKALFRTFEEKHELLRVLNSCLESESGRVQVIIGSENPSPDMADCSLIASGYGAGGRTLGALGIIGPTRMEYARAIALVDSVARLFTHALTRYSD